MFWGTLTSMFYTGPLSSPKTDRSDPRQSKWSHFLCIWHTRSRWDRRLSGTVSSLLQHQTPSGLNGHVYVWHMQLLSPWDMMETDEREDEEPTWTNQTWDTSFFFPYIRKPILNVWATCFFLTFSFQKLKYLNDLTQLTTLKDLLCIY